MDEKISQLEFDIDQMRNLFEQRADALDQRIRQVRCEFDAIPQEQTVYEDKAAHEEQAVTPSIDLFEQKPAPMLPEPEVIEAVFVEPIVQEPVAPKEKQQPQKQAIDFVTPVVSQIGFIESALAKVKGVYQHYRDEGKAAVFLMTLAGLIAMTLGFGYLLQYGFNNLMSEGLKVSFGYVVSAGFAAIGIWLTLKKPQFGEYASSLIGLGLVLAYVSSYFSGVYFNLVGPSANLACLVLITALAYYLALTFETRVVAIITLLGGTLCPMIFNFSGAIDSVFVTYLLLLSAANLHLSHKIQWPLLAKMTFVLTLGVIEFSGFAQTGGLSGLLLLSALFYLFTYFWSFDGLRAKDTIDRTAISILTANLFYLLYALLSQPGASDVSSGVILVTHAVVIGGVFKLFQLKNHALSALYFVMLSLFVACAIFVLLPVDAKGLLWGVEGLALMYAGFRFNNVFIRLEGYVILLLAVASLAGQWAVDFVAQHQMTTTLDWFRTLSLGGLIWAGYRLIEQYHTLNQRFEKRISALLIDGFTLWATLGWLLFVYAINPAFVTVSAIVPMAWAFYRADKFQLRFSEILAWLPLGLLILQIFFGYLDTGTLRFSKQSPLTLFAWVELGFCLWSLQWVYEKRDIDGSYLQYAKKLRALVYLCLPLLFLPRVMRLLPEFTATATWVSTILAWGLYKVVGNKALRWEMNVLYALSIILTVVTMLLGDTSTAYPAVGTSLVFIVALMWVEKPFNRQALKQSNHQTLLQLNLFYIAFCLFALVSLNTGSLQYGLLTSAACLLAFVYKKPTITLMRSQLRTAFLIAFIASAQVLLSSYGSPDPALSVTLKVLIAITLIGLMTVPTNQTNRVIYAWLSPLFSSIITVRLCAFNGLLAAGYLCIVNQWFGTPLAVVTSILLVLHAMGVLFLTLKAEYQSLTRLSGALFALTAAKVIFYDMVDYAMVHKVIALMGIGAILLMGAYMFQSLKTTSD